MAKRASDNDDFASALFADAPTGGDANDVSNMPRSEDGTLRCAIFTEPARSSWELEERERQAQSRPPIDVVFVDEDGREIPKGLTDAERAELAKHFTEAEWRELEAILR